MIVAMWVSLEQMATIHHHLLKTIPLSLLTALRPKVKPMASRMKGSSMSRLHHNREDSSQEVNHCSLTAIQDRHFNGYQKPNGYYHQNGNK